MKKWFRRIGLMTVLIGVIAGAFLLLRPTDRITKENFAKILGGMTVKEVEAILGPAHSKEASGLIRPQEHCYWYGRKGSEAGARQKWISIDLMDGLVIGKDMDFGEPLHGRVHSDNYTPNLWERIMDWLGLSK